MKLFSIFDGKKTTKVATAYTKEFTYLPSYHWIQATEYTPATLEEPFGEAKYLINNTKDTPVYVAYRDILIKDGWAITDEMAVTRFSANKDTHIANIWIIISDNDVILNVRSK